LQILFYTLNLLSRPMIKTFCRDAMDGLRLLNLN